MIYTYENLFVAYFSINGRFLSRFFEKIQHFQIYFFRVPNTFLMTFEFWTLCACFIYLFVVYFSFAPVISAITHLYCELFYIQVLTMVIITETLTSTSHHDIFTYLDYIFFPATFIPYGVKTVRPRLIICDFYILLKIWPRKKIFFYHWKDRNFIFSKEPWEINELYIQWKLEDYWKNVLSNILML